MKLSISFLCTIGSKRLKLTLHDGQQEVNLRVASRSISSSNSDPSSCSGSTSAEPILLLEKATRNTEVSDQLVELTTKIKQKHLKAHQAREVSIKLNDLLNKSSYCTVQGTIEYERTEDNSNNVALSTDLKLQIYICMADLIASYLIPEKEAIEFDQEDVQDIEIWADKDEKKVVSNTLRIVLKEYCDTWVHKLKLENLAEPKAAILSLISRWFKANETLCQPNEHEVLWVEIKNCLANSNHQVKINALNVLGSGITAISSIDRSIAPDILTLVGRYTGSQDPRVRNAAFEALLDIHKQDYKLDVILYKDFCKALDDDYEGVRRAALKLVYVMSRAYPEHLIKVANHHSNRQVSKFHGSTGLEREGEGNREVRLEDDAFGKICNGVNDLSVHVREKAMQLIGNFSKVSSISVENNGVSQIFLEQTLDKKLMSNMRTKKSAHEREAKMVSAGEWSSGKTWADDGPREEIGADDVNLMSFGACGAFIHGLEDEFMCVRLAAIESLTRLSIQNAKLASTALDFLVDMFNDEIELVRLKAIESLTRIANHIILQVHQLETIMSALDDYSMIVREKLHLMLQASTIATKDGLQNVITKLLENIKRYPQDKRSILLTFKSLGLKHADIALPLVTQLLEIHPFFDTAEPDVEDPCYLCILVLIFNAAQKSPTLKPLLDHHTKRHFNYLIYTYPHLAKDRNSSHNYSISSMMGLNYSKSQLPAIKKRFDGGSNTVRFFQQVLDRVWSSVNGNLSLGLDGKIKILHRAQGDLERLGSIEPAVEDAATFASLYIQAQGTLLKCLSCRFWNNSTAMFTQQGELVNNAITEMFRLCTQLQGRFVISSANAKYHKGGNATESNDNAKKARLTTVHQIRQICVLKLKAMALHLVFLVRASNKSALIPTECFFKEIEKVKRRFLASNDGIRDTGDNFSDNDFLQNLLSKFSEVPGGSEGRKPGLVARTLQPLLYCPLEPLLIKEISQVSMSRAIVYEPTGSNEMPLKYTAGLVLAVPVDCDLIHVRDISLVKISIRTPDQKISLVTPKASDFCGKEDPGSYRLRTNALMSHNVWSEALHVEISIVMDFCHDAISSSNIGQSSRAVQSLGDNTGSGIETCSSIFKIVNLCEPIKVNVFPKPIKRGI